MYFPYAITFTVCPTHYDSFALFMILITNYIVTVYIIPLLFSGI